MEEINRVMLKLLEPVRSTFRKTMTFDNGREFCGHEKLSERLQIETFFATPYHSWERELNEHTNGLIREFYPKSTNFKIVKEDNFQKVVNLINYRPRKSLDYRTAYEVFFASSDTVAFHPRIGKLLNSKPLNHNLKVNLFTPNY
jgi:IS30 family transposase